MRAKKNTTERDEHKVPSRTLMSAKMQTGGGVHGGGARRRNRTERRAARQQLRSGNYDD